MVLKKLNALWRRHLTSHASMLPALRLFWVFTVLIGELGVFFWSLAGCRWPTVDTGHASDAAQTTHVLLVADPQVQHPALIAPKSWWASPLRRIMFELNLRKSWHVTSRLNPNAVIFLGDMLANGKAATSFQQYNQAAAKFKSVFAIDPSTEVYYVPGNNDVGLGMVPAASQKLRSYYSRAFGPLNQQLEIQNHTFVALDAPGLLDEDYMRHGMEVSFAQWKPLPEGSVAFVKALADYEPDRVILLSHIPLSRSESAYCGPLRERGSIRRGAGPGWQSMLGKQTSRFLLESLRPMLVFSADNRDYCEHQHVLPPRSRAAAHRTHDEVTREVTLKSFSMSVHIHKPGFQLLTLVDPAKLANPDLSSVADTTCLLPDQYKIYSSYYTPLFFLSFIVLLCFNFKYLLGGKNSRRGFSDLSLSRSSSSKGLSSPGLRSSLWSPFIPFSPVTPGLKPSSPRGQLPSHLRTPQNGSASHFIASSQPSSPAAIPGSPSFLSVPGLFQEKDAYTGYDDETDMMYPAQYANHQNSGLHSSRPGSRRTSIDKGHRWGAGDRGHPDDEYDMVQDQDIQPADQEASPVIRAEEFGATTPLSHRRWHWSHSFTFVLGRPRRVTVGIPSLAGIRNLLDLVGLGGTPSAALTTAPSIRSRRSRKQGPTAFLLDILSVFWPSVVVWVIINWTIL